MTNQDQKNVMTETGMDWVSHASQLDGPGFAKFQTALTDYNSVRLQPGLPDGDWRDELARQAKIAAAEVEFLEAARRRSRRWPRRYRTALTRSLNGTRP